jgi:hypothetical protein
MANPIVFPGDAPVQIQGSLALTGTLTTPWDRENHMRLRETQEFTVQLTDLRVWDAFQTVLPGTAASDDLGLIGGTFGTNSPTVRTSDADNTTVTQYARFLWKLPYSYVAGEDVLLRAYAGMNTSTASATATIDFEVYRCDGTGGIGSDLCGTAAQSINSTANANKDFTISDSTLNPGDMLDCRVTIAITDSGAGTACIGEIGRISFLIDLKP